MQQDEPCTEEGLLPAVCGGGFGVTEVLPNLAGASPSSLCGISVRKAHSHLCSHESHRGRLFGCRRLCRYFFCLRLKAKVLHKVVFLILVREEEQEGV